MRLIKPDEWDSYYSELRGYHDSIATRTEYDMGYTDALDRVDDWMDELPTVDAVEVVRCKDCTYRSTWDAFAGCYWCNGERKTPEAFCSDGERRADNAAD